MIRAAVIKPETPFRIGQYAVIREVGRGPWGTVFLAHDPLAQRDLALKTLTRVGLEKLKGLTRLLDEARTISQLSHPAIVSLLDAGFHDSVPYLAAEYVSGESLSAYIRANGALPARHAIVLMLPVMEALALAHRREILHGDVKPANIFLGDRGQARIGDFGLCSLIRSGAIAGTLAYLAPECHDGVMDERTEVFSLGMTLYELLAGRPAIQASDSVQARRTVESGLVTPLPLLSPQVDDRLWSLISRAMTPDARQRYASVEQFYEVLSDYLSPPMQRRDDAQGTVEYVLRKVNNKSEFPALSHAIKTIAELADADDIELVKLSDAILRDPALTHKLLQVANSTYFRGVHKSPVTTISRAVMLLGFDEVRNAALALTLIDALANQAQQADLKAELYLSLRRAQLVRLPQGLFN